MSSMFSLPVIAWKYYISFTFYGLWSACCYKSLPVLTCVPRQTCNVFTNLSYVNHWYPVLSLVVTSIAGLEVEKKISRPAQVQFSPVVAWSRCLSLASGSGCHVVASHFRCECNFCSLWYVWQIIKVIIEKSNPISVIAIVYFLSMRKTKREDKWVYF